MSSETASRAPLRVAMVSRRVHPAHGPGGLERHVFDLVTGLAARGVAIDLYSETPPDPRRLKLADHALSGAVTPHWIDGGRLPVGSRKGTIVVDRITNYFLWSRRVARQVINAVEAPDIVHVHGLAGWGLARAARRGRLSRPLVVTTQGLEEFRSHRWLKHLAYLPFRRGMVTIARASAAVVTTDRALTEVVERYLGCPAEHQIVIPNAINASRCRELARVDHECALLAKHGLEQAAPLFLSVGRIEANKGFDVMVDALARIAKDLPAAWTWVLAGDGPERSAIRKAITAAGLEAHCVLPGRVDERDLHSWYAVADWFVHPTRYEGSSLVTLEAMAHARPVIASRTGGLPDKVKDGVTGFLVPAGDAGALAERLMAATEADGRTFGEAGRRLCDEAFSLDAVIPRYIALYERLRSDMRRTA